MHVYVVFCHPGKRSFTFSVLSSFIAGLQEAGHTYSVGDLYAMDWKSDMDLDQYERETSYEPSLPVPADVAAEQNKIGESEGIWGRSATALCPASAAWRAQRAQHME